MKNLRWPSDDPLDRAWAIFRWTIEEANARYGLVLYGTIRFSFDLATIQVASEDHHYSFAYSLTSLADLIAPPSAIMEGYPETVIRLLAEARDMEAHIVKRSLEK